MISDDFPVIVFIIFAGPGLFVGFVLPGDSVLFTAGLLAQTGVFHLGYLLPLVILAALLGYEFGYWFGARFLFRHRLSEAAGGRHTFGVQWSPAFSGTVCEVLTHSSYTFQIFGHGGVEPTMFLSCSRDATLAPKSDI